MLILLDGSYDIRAVVFSKAGKVAINERTKKHTMTKFHHA